MRFQSVQPDDLFMLIFTSGTSGDPKAVMCSHGKVGIAGVTMTDRFSLGPADICYASMPLFHSNAVLVGWAVALACRPLGVMTAEHWALATGLLEDPGTDAARREFLVLLRDGLGTQLGGEVALSDGSEPDAAGADDIGLAREVLARQTDKDEST